MAFSKSDLINMSSPSVYGRGLVYYHEARVRITSLSGAVTEAVVDGNQTKPYRVVLKMSANGDRLVSCACGCAAFAERYTPICKHIVATLLTIQNNANKPIIQNRRSDNGAISMLNRYMRSVVDKASEKHVGRAVLEPVLESGIPPSLFFRVGEKRMYIVQDVSMLAIHLSNRETASYGKFELWHDPSAFDEKSRRIAALFLKRYSATNQSYGMGYMSRYVSPSQSKRSMYLSPQMADELFGLLADGELSIRYADMRIRSVWVTREDYKPRLSLKMIGNGASLEVEESYDVIPGDKGLHILTDERLYSCGEAFSNACGELLTALNTKEGSLFFAEKELGLLFSVLLPQVEAFVDLRTQGDFAAYYPQPMEAKIYLDTPGPGCITARMTYTYGDKTFPAFEKKRVVMSRDLPKEIMAENLLIGYFDDLVHDGGILRIDDDADAVFRFVTEGIEAVSQIGQVFASDAFGKIKVQQPVSVTVGVKVDAGLLQVDIDIEGLDLSELPELLASYRARKKYHLLRDGSFLPLDGTALTGLSDLAEGLDLTDKQLVSGHASLAHSRALYLDAICKQNEALRFDRDSAFKRMLREMKDVENADYPVPDDLRRVLRNYQKTGFRWLKTIAACGFGGILADDMGLGKTLQVLTLLASYQEDAEREAPQGERHPSIVVCPTSLCLNWESEAKRFTPSLRTCTVTGTAAERGERIAAWRSYDLLITSYDLLKRDIERYGGIRFAHVIIDEAQYIKNQATQNAKSVKALVGAHRFALTGTPVENSLAELWSIFDFMMPGYLFTYSRFKKRYEEPIVKSGSEEASTRLKQLVRPFLLRRLKRDVLKELPPKTETTLRFEMVSEQKKLYIAMQANVKKELRERLGMMGQDRIAILAALTRLRQICCDPSLLYENYHDGSAKLEGCMELIEGCIAAGRRMLLFSQFTSMLDIIEQRLHAMGVKPPRIDGSTNPSSRLELVNAFNAGSVPVFLISLKAGGTGLNLTGADVVIHYDPWWNVSAQNQATDRAHRIGQKNPVQVYKLIAKDTIEERIVALQKKKADLVDAVIAENASPLERFSGEELLALLEA